jgi:hypothetical protein
MSAVKKTFQVTEESKPDDDDWHTVQAWDAEEAAEAFGEKIHEGGEWHHGKRHVFVKVGGDVVKKFTVTIDWSPTFNAYEIEKS